MPALVFAAVDAGIVKFSSPVVTLDSDSIDDSVALDDIDVEFIVSVDVDVGDIDAVVVVVKALSVLVCAKTEKISISKKIIR